ncbi:MAG: hypothetical protein QOD41_3232, partial [Cryptosporangiaceae bacterium]|nr:hypothetical protein [Cryptosporangiaceae bacterium]
MTDSAVGGLPGTSSPAAPLAVPVGGRRARSAPRRSSPMVLAQLAVIALAVVLWWYLSGVAPSAVPSPAQTFSELATLAGTGALWTAVGQTSTAWLIGIAICTLAGIPLGLLIGASRIATDSTRLTIDFVRNIPPVALVPLGLLLWGPTRNMVL